MLLGSPQTITLQVGYRDLVRGLKDLGLNKQQLVVVHASLSSFGHVQGGAQTVVGALLATCDTVITPAFTYQTMITPETGPELNGLDYGVSASNVDAEFWSPTLPIHRDIGQIPETLRQHPQTKRSLHPILSFIANGTDANEILATQTYDDPLAPLSWVADHNGLVLMLGTTHATNTMIHVGEVRAGRNYFTRWALTPEAIVTVSWPGDSSGFTDIAPYVKNIATRTQIGAANLQLFPAKELVSIAQNLIHQDPMALLCSDPTCERCRDMRRRVGK